MGKKIRKHHQQPTHDQLEAWIAAVEVAPNKAAREEKRQAKRKRREERRGNLKKAREDGTVRNDTRHGSHDATNNKPPPPVQDSTRQKLKDLSERLLGNVGKFSARSQQSFFAASAANSTVATKKKLNLQPRKCDYGGLGLARPSLFISVQDLSWKPQLEEEFTQHIPGFFGKQRTKAMKKQLDGDMLWRRRLNEKKERDAAKQKKGGEGVGVQGND